MRYRVLGAVTPDLPGLALAVGLAARGTPVQHLLHAIYRRRAWRWVHLALHSVLGPLALQGLGHGSSAARAWAQGWAGHLIVDYGSHHTDAWPALWPLSNVAWASRISYWEPDHHARALSAVETAAICTAVLGDHRPAGRLFGLAVGLLAAAPLVAPRGQSMWEARGLRP